MSKRGVICLTGDVHHMSLRTSDQAFLKGTEVDAALEYVNILSQHDLNVTLFVTGKAVKEETDKLRQISNRQNVQLGGHNYYAFKPRLPFKVCNKWFNIKNGPAFFQNWEIKKTIETFKQVLGYDICSWRDHGYRHDKNTARLLKKSGIKYFSDRIGREHAGPENKEGLVHIPINVLPDHDYVYHARRLPGSFDEQTLINSPFGTGAMSIEQWFEAVTGDVENVVKNDGVATLLIHPACMQIADQFKTFEKICRFLKQFETVKMNEL